jgi:hypothetical protein
LPPGIYFRLLLIGYFEGIDSERGIAWRAADSLALRNFLGLDLHDVPPDHSTISRTRRLIVVETHRAVFTWVAQCLGQRRVTLDVTVDGVPGAALGVMSQGELHSLALSLFLPRATLPDSPFRFVVIDDPVQSMDPSRVDGLARALEQVAATRQVIVFTHDERLSEAVRRLAINATILGLTRRPKSIVEIKTALDPVQAHIEDARALARTTQLPMDVLQKLVPGFCRSALEAACTQAFRRKRLAAGKSHESVEQELELAGKLTPLAALAFFDDRERGGDVMKRLNQIGGWAGDVFKQCKDGVHEVQSTDIRGMINDAERLAKTIAEVR